MNKGIAFHVRQGVIEQDQIGMVGAQPRQGLVPVQGDLADGARRAQRVRDQFQ